jgi:preprotein translocase subunit SecA
LSEQDWGDIADEILGAVEEVFDRRHERYLSQDGQITRDVRNALGRIQGPIYRSHLYKLLLLLPQGTRAAFDKKTHRRVWQRTTRLTFSYFAASLLENQEPEAISDDVLDHLEDAQEAIRQAWGQVEAARLSASTLSALDQETQNGLQKALGEQAYQELAGTAIQNLSADHREIVVDDLGRQALTAIYRQLILSVITELWVDYLTQMEALRVSIGLEAYAQRDPLVQYKNRAYELFQTLLSDMRMGVVSRMFTYRPRDISKVQTTVAKDESPKEEPELVASEEAEKTKTDGQKPVVEQDKKPAAEKDGKPSAKPEKKKGKGGRRKAMSISQKRRRSRK